LSFYLIVSVSCKQRLQASTCEYMQLYLHFSALQSRCSIAASRARCSPMSFSVLADCWRSLTSLRFLEHLDPFAASQFLLLLGLLSCPVLSYCEGGPSFGQNFKVMWRPMWQAKEKWDIYRKLSLLLRI